MDRDEVDGGEPVGIGTCPCPPAIDGVERRGVSMLSTLRRMFRYGVRQGFKLMAVFLAVGYGLSLWTPTPAWADAKVDNWKTVVLSDVARNLRMMALEDLKEDGSSAALDAIAKESEHPMQMTDCADRQRCLGRAIGPSKAKGGQRIE